MGVAAMAAMAAAVVVAVAAAVGVEEVGVGVEVGEAGKTEWPSRPRRSCTG